MCYLVSNNAAVDGVGLFPESWRYFMKNQYGVNRYGVDGVAKPGLRVIHK